MQRAVVYLIDGIFYLHSEALCDSGYWMLYGPVVAVEASQYDNLCSSLLARLAASRTDVATPHSVDDVVIPLCIKTGRPSWSAIFVDMKCVSVRLADQTITLFPLRRIHEDSSLMPIDGVAMSVLSSDASGLEQALVEAFIVAT
jgi:hypothetical protein